MGTLGINVSSFWGELSLLDPCVELGVEFVEGALERGIDGAQGWRRCGQTRAKASIEGALERGSAGRKGWKSGGQTRAEYSIVGPPEEQGHPQAEFSDAVAEAVGH